MQSTHKKKQFKTVLSSFKIFILLENTNRPADGNTNSTAHPLNNRPKRY